MDLSLTTNQPARGFRRAGWVADNSRRQALTVVDQATSPS